MNKSEQIHKLLNNIRADFYMLQAGEWEPDEHSVQASIDSVEKVMGLLEVEEDE